MIRISTKPQHSHCINTSHRMDRCILYITGLDSIEHTAVIASSNQYLGLKLPLLSVEIMDKRLVDDIIESLWCIASAYLMRSKYLTRQTWIGRTTAYTARVPFLNPRAGALPLQVASRLYSANADPKEGRGTHS
jgi:hypothetical protein